MDMHDAFGIFEAFFGGKDPFEELLGGGGLDGLLGGGMGGFGGGFTSMTTIGGGFGGGSCSTSSSTRIVNGKRVTRTERVERRADGTVQRTVTEEERGRDGRVTQRVLEGPGQGGGGAFLEDSSRRRGSSR